MTFKELLKKDLDTFVNLGEFAEYHNIDNAIVAAVVDKYTQQKSGSDSKTFTKLHGDFCDIYCKTKDLLAKREQLPKHGDIIKVDGRSYKVDTCENEHGITILTLNSYRQNLVGAAAKIGGIERLGDY